MKPLALTALVHEGPMARAYLGLLHSEGNRLERLVLMVSKRDPAHRTLVAPWLFLGLRLPLARMVQDLRMNHWPREFLRRHATLCKPWLRSMGQVFGFDAGAYQSLTERPSYARYADFVDVVFTDGLADRALHEHLQALPSPTTLLFTGGGKVPSSLLDLPGKRFIHVHPGVLPHVRGSDGLLWSMLLRGRPGATAFYMSPGLDTGDIICATDLPAVPPLPAGWAGLDSALAYRLLYAFVDPMLRAVLLRRVLTEAGGALHDLPTQAQRDDEGTTFHFMNERMRRFAFARMQTLADAQGLAVELPHG